MMASRGMGDINPSKMPKGMNKPRRDDTDFKQYKKGGKTSLDASDRIKKMADGGLYDNIHAKQKRIARGSGEKMRKPGSPGAPTEEAFIKSAKTRKKK